MPATAVTTIMLMAIARPPIKPPTAPLPTYRLDKRVEFILFLSF
jgi:hypothetical protein